MARFRQIFLAIRGNLYYGRLVKIQVWLLAEYGNDIKTEATVFVPQLEEYQSWDIPNFIGLDGLLNNIRFAIDPLENMFYFGLA